MMGHLIKFNQGKKSSIVSLTFKKIKLVTKRDHPRNYDFNQNTESKFHMIERDEERKDERKVAKIVAVHLPPLYPSSLPFFIYSRS